MRKGTLPEDPRGLLFEAYRMDGIGAAECRTIFLDWVLGLPAEADAAAAVEAALAHYAPAHPDHPMTIVLQENRGTPARTGRRGGSRGRRG